MLEWAIKEIVKEEAEEEKQRKEEERQRREEEEGVSPAPASSSFLEGKGINRLLYLLLLIPLALIALNYFVL